MAKPAKVWLVIVDKHVDCICYGQGEARDAARELRGGGLRPRVMAFADQKAVEEFCDLVASR